MLRVTIEGAELAPEVPHNVAAWGAVKEVLRINGGQATREQILDVLHFVQRGDGPKPNVRFLDYAIRTGWLEEG